MAEAMDIELRLRPVRSAAWAGGKRTSDWNTKTVAGRCGMSGAVATMICRSRPKKSDAVAGELLPRGCSQRDR